MAGGTGYAPLPEPVVANPLAAINAGTQAASNVYDLRAKQAEAAWGQAVQQATDQQTGVTDWDRARGLAAGNPLAVQGMMKGAKEAGDIQTQQQTRNLAAGGALTDLITPLLRPGLSDDQFWDGIHTAAQMARAKGVPAAVVDGMLLHLSPDRAQATQQLRTLGMGQLTPEQRQTQTYGAPTTVDQGTGIASGVQLPASQGGGIRLSGSPSVPVYAPPGTQGSQVQWQDSDGVNHNTTWAEYNIARNNGRVVGPPTVTPAAPGSGGGGPGGGPNAPNAPGPNNQPRLSPQADGGKQTDTTGPQPGMQKKWDASADLYNTENTAAGQYQQRMFPLAQADALLSSGNVNTGKGAEGWNTVRSYLQTFAGHFGWNAQDIQSADTEKLAKYLQQIINTNPFASHSDSMLASAISGNPSTHISTLANQDVVKAMIGMERYRQAAVMAAREGNIQPKDFMDFQTRFSTQYDPRAFLFDKLDADKRAKLTASLKSPEQRRAFDRSLTLIEKHPDLMSLAALPP